LVSLLKPTDSLSRRHDPDALMAADAEQVAVTRHDELGAAGHRRGDDVIVVCIAAATGSGLNTVPLGKVCKTPGQPCYPEC